MFRTVRLLVVACAAACVLATAVLCVLIWLGNRSKQPVEPRQLSTALGRAMHWLDANHAAALADSNPALWWMLAEADETLGGDARLQALITEYKTKSMRFGTAPYLWHSMFDESAATRVPPEAWSYLPPYNLHFLYALTCDELLGQLEVVRAQNDASYCPRIWIVHPHCRSHQLMGLLWALHRGCSEATQEAAVTVRDAMWREESLEVRVDDAYIQRALLLAFVPSRTAPLKRIWIARILAQQLPDGGWDGDYAAFGLPSGRYLMLSAGGMTVRQPVSSFHTTAQVILLLSRVLRNTTEEGSSRLARWSTLKDN